LLRPAPTFGARDRRLTLDGSAVSKPSGSFTPNGLVTARHRSWGWPHGTSN